MKPIRRLGTLAAALAVLTLGIAHATQAGAIGGWVSVSSNGSLIVVNDLTNAPSMDANSGIYVQDSPTLSPPTLVVHSFVLPVQASVGCTQRDPHTVLCTGTMPVAVFGNGGDDYLFVHTLYRDLYVIGGAGNDTIDANAGVEPNFQSLTHVRIPYVGNPIPDREFGYFRATVYGDSAATTMPGDGNDTITVRAQFQTIEGGGGDDNITANEQIRPFNFDDPLGCVPSDSGFGDETGDRPCRPIHQPVISDIRENGGDGNDTITGSALPDIIHGGDGNDTINAGAGADIVYGDAGDDTIDGYFGRDTIDGGTGADTITGGPANDTIYIDDHQPDKSVKCGGGSYDTVFIDKGEGSIVAGCETIKVVS